MLSLCRALRAYVLCCLVAFFVGLPLAAKGSEVKGSELRQAMQRSDAMPPHVAPPEASGETEPVAADHVLSGTVVDPSGASVTNAQVHVESTTLRRDTTTDDGGR